MTVSPMPRLLAEIEVYRQLKTLPDWDGDARRITRTVRTTDPDALVAVVDAEAEHARHHATVERSGSDVTVVLSTQGGVTQHDIEVAHRLDGVIRAFVGAARSSG